MVVEMTRWVYRGKAWKLPMSTGWIALVGLGSPRAGGHSDVTFLLPRTREGQFKLGGDRYSD